MTLLKIENLTKNLSSHSGENLPLLRHINLETKLSKTTALLQLSGKNASLLLRIMAGQLLPDCGKIILNGTDILPDTTPHPKTNIQYIIPALPDEKGNKCSLSGHFRKKKDKPLRSLFCSKTNRNYRLLLPASFYQTDGRTLKLPQELLPHQHILLSLLPSLASDPDIMLIDTLPAVTPEEATGKALREIAGITSAKSIPLLFTTHSPQLAFHLADHILVFRDEHLLHTVKNTEHHPEILKELLQQQQEATAYTPVHSASLHPLIGQQYV